MHSSTTLEKTAVSNVIDKYDLKIIKTSSNDASVKIINNKSFVIYDIYSYNWITDDWDYFDSSYEDEYKFTNLNSSTPYKFQFRTKTDNQFAEPIIGEILFYTKPNTPVISSFDSEFDQITINWSNIENSTPDTKYLIYRKTETEDFKLYKELQNVNKFVDKDITMGCSYSYKIKTVFYGKDSKVDSEFSNIVDVTVPVLLPMSIPEDIQGTCKTYAYYTAVTVKNSPQYKLLNSKKCFTDEKTGIKMVDDCYCIALGSFYGSTIGTKYKITLSTGKTFKAILCDQKANVHTDKTHRYAVKNKDIIEFYVEKGKIPASVDGDYNVLPQFHGKVISIEKIL